ncbi:hypothetical protein [Streptomyces sp. NPDC005125]
MKARVITSLALPAALATAGLLNTAEAAYAATAGSDTLTSSAKYGYQEQPMGDVTLAPGSVHPCTPMGNVTITDYGHHCCTPVGNMTVTDYGQYSTPVGNVTVCYYGRHHEHGYDDYDNYFPWFQQQHS